MIGKTAGCMILLSVLAGAWLGQGGALGQAVLDSIGVTVELTLTLAGMMAFWNGMMSVLREAGLIRRLSRLARPLLRLFFPDAASGVGAEEICANMTANLLGLGNAATPAGVRAACTLHRLDGGEAASDELCRLVVLNTASVQLLPTTTASLRAALGAAAPFDILPAVWLASLLSVSAGLLAERLLAKCR